MSECEFLHVPSFHTSIKYSSERLGVFVLACMYLLTLLKHIMNHGGAFFDGNTQTGAL